ncbi:MAG: hypothetical protein SAL07_12755 [Oscillatoria sp. PMC 1051.18]|nr:hypothetical protein [Oscillatoria sp. PMC 1050.18]MEC5030760.1 hypothetical protein [Oscillatoria sp. PMC 1051.18]
MFTYFRLVATAAISLTLVMGFSDLKANAQSCSCDRLFSPTLTPITANSEGYTPPDNGSPDNSQGAGGR